jgi:hypothetical protein
MEAEAGEYCVERQASFVITGLVPGIHTLPAAV